MTRARSQVGLTIEQLGGEPKDCRITLKQIELRKSNVHAAEPNQAHTSGRIKSASISRNGPSNDYLKENFKIRLHTAQRIYIEDTREVLNGLPRPLKIFFRLWLQNRFEAKGEKRFSTV
jgi:hypothetical protein